MDAGEDEAGAATGAAAVGVYVSLDPHALQISCGVTLSMMVSSVDMTVEM